MLLANNITAIEPCQEINAEMNPAPHTYNILSESVRDIRARHQNTRNDTVLYVQLDT